MVYLDKAIETYTKSCRQNCALVYVELEMVSPLAGQGSQYLLHIVNAGCIPPYVRYRDGKVEQPEIGGFALGQGLGTLVGYQQHILELASEDIIILTSDGVVEAKNERGEMLGFERLEAIIRRGPITSAAAMLNHIKMHMQFFTQGVEQHDDITLVVVRM
jgi:serine phosphatase RsbU (regulator of sigma subunit)